MKKTLFLSIITATSLYATEYNIYLTSFKNKDYVTLNKIADKVRPVVENSQYKDELVVRAKPSYPVTPNNKIYHTVAAETDDISLTKVREIRDFLIANTEYKDAYFVRKSPNEPTFKQVKSGDYTVKSEPEAEPMKAYRPAEIKSDSVASTLDNLEQDNENSLEIPSFNKVERENSISLNKMIENVLDSNPRINASKQEYLKSLKDLDIASAEYYPMLNIYANGGYVKKNHKIHDNEKQTGKGSTHDASVVLTENIFNGGKDMNKKAEQSHLANASAFRHIQNANEITYESSKAYLDVIKSKLLLEIAEKNVKAHEEIYELIKDRTSSGFARASEERQAGSRLALAKNNFLSAQNDYFDAQARFNRLFGNSVDINSLVMPEFNESLPTNLDELNELSKKCNPSVRLQSENISALEYNTKVKKGNYLPKLDLELSADYKKDKIFKDLKQDSKDTSAGAYLRFSYNLFNKGQDKLNVEKSKLSALAGQMDYSSTLRELNESNSYAYNSYEISKDKLTHLNNYVEYAKATLLTYQDEFKIGKRDLINVLDAQSEYFSAAKELINTENTVLLTQYKILANLGVLPDSFVEGYAQSYIKQACTISDIK